jgi:hypothetical protein
VAASLADRLDVATRYRAETPDRHCFAREASLIEA